jgi:hypothetical protein
VEITSGPRWQRVCGPFNYSFGKNTRTEYNGLKEEDISKKDRLREFVILAQEAYIVSATPPAIDYSRNVDPTFRDDLTRRSRAFLLRLSIDVKYIVVKLLEGLPLRRAKILHGWIQDDSEYSWAKLTYKQKQYLLRDKKTLHKRLKEGLIWKNTI